MDLSVLPVTKKTVIPKTSSEIFKGWPPPKISVKIKVRPVRPMKRSDPSSRRHTDFGPLTKQSSLGH